MKKLFVSIFALAAFAACQSDFNDVNLDAPQGGGAIVNVGGEHTLYAEVGVGKEDTKATYNGLVATWEQGDQIALLQEHADYGKTFSTVNKLNIKDGVGTSKALFNGDISVDGEAPRIYHIAYPASAVSFSTTMSQETVVTNYNDNVDWNVSGYIGQSTGYGVCTYNSTLKVTIPTTGQSGKWEPYMYASTSEAVNADGIGAKTLTTLNGAIAIRAFDPDGVTSKQLKQITITADVAIAGAFEGTATSVGNTQSVTGSATGGTYSESDREAEALANLTSALQGYEATSTSVTKAMSLSFKGSDKSITISGLESIPADSEGFYTYYINIAPATFEASTLVIEATDTKDAVTKKTVKNAISVDASQLAGVKVVWEEASLNCSETTIETWYNDWNNNSAFELAGSTIYVDNISVEGNILAENVKTLGVMINDTLHEASVESGVVEISPIIISGLTSGKYTVQPYAVVTLNGVDTEFFGSKVEKTVTTIPTVTDFSAQSSYSSNGNTSKTNKITGTLLKVKANISDSYIASYCVDGTKYEIWNSNGNTNTKIGEKALGEEWSSDVALGQYGCYVKISLLNGYSFTSEKTYTTHVTGIPYYIDPTSASPSGWNTNNTGSQDSRLLLKKSSAYIVSNNLFYVPENCDVDVIVRTAAYHGWGSSTNNLYINPTVSGVVKSGTAISVKGDQYYPDQAQWENKTQVCTLTASANEISIYADIPKSNGIQGFTGSIMIEDLWVNYKLQQ